MILPILENIMLENTFQQIFFCLNVTVVKSLTSGKTFLGDYTFTHWFGMMRDVIELVSDSEGELGKWNGCRARLSSSTGWEWFVFCPHCPHAAMCVLTKHRWQQYSGWQPVMHFLMSFCAEPFSLGLQKSDPTPQSVFIRTGPPKFSKALSYTVEPLGYLSMQFSCLQIRRMSGISAWLIFWHIGYIPVSLLITMYWPTNTRFGPLLAVDFLKRIFWTCDIHI